MNNKFLLNSIYGKSATEDMDKEKKLLLAMAYCVIWGINIYSDMFGININIESKGGDNSH